MISQLTRDLLSALVDAGADGLTSGDLTDRFTGPASRVNRNARINSALGHQATMGRVKRGEPERSPRYRGPWTRRWFITSAGRTYLDVLNGLDGGGIGIPPHLQADISGQLETCTADLENERRRYAALRKVLIGPHPLSLPQPARDRAMLELREAGCELELIGAVFGVTGERARQVVREQSLNRRGNAGKASAR